MVPIILIAVFCFGKSSKPASRTEDKKKSDEPTPDDNEPETTSETRGEKDEPEREDEVSDLEPTVAEEPVKVSAPEPSSPKKRKARKD